MRKRSLSILLLISLLFCQTACKKAEETNHNTNENGSPTAVSENPVKPDKAQDIPTVTPDTPTPTTEQNPPTQASTPTPMPKGPTEIPESGLKPYNDVHVTAGKLVIEEGKYTADDIVTYWFNKRNEFQGNEELQAKVMEDGKNPGLGVRKLHEEGITGKGVNVAIIDQNLYVDHPEYSQKIVEYFDTGCKAKRGSMHGPCVASILVGDSIGVAPDAKLYYVATPGWLGDSSYLAKGLDWIVEENNKLPEGEKIRVVSVSAAPSGQGSPFTENTDMWDVAVKKAKDNGILVLDCGSYEGLHVVGSVYFDLEDREDPEKCSGGYPNYPMLVASNYIGAPTCYRTLAEEYKEGKCDYQYMGQGGQSWAVPYIAGVLALGWQVNPDLNKEEIMKILFDTRVQGKDGSYVVNPPAFIEEVKKTIKG